jgi:hypothetical protein
VLERKEWFSKLPPTEVGKNNGAAFRKNEDYNDFVGKNKVSFVT